LKSEIPQSSIRNPKSAISMAYSPDHSPSSSPSPRSDLRAPLLPDPVAAIAYASCTPAGIEPAMDDSVLISRAAYDRLNRAAARAETLVLYRLDMLSGVRDSLDVDQERLERSIQNLWRLTAVRKTLLSLEASLNAPTSTSTPPPDDAILQQLSENIDKALAEEAELEADDEDDDEAKDATPVPEATPSATPAPSASTGVNSSNQPSPSHASHASHSSYSSLNPQSEIRNPQCFFLSRQFPPGLIARSQEISGSPSPSRLIHLSLLSIIKLIFPTRLPGWILVLLPPRSFPDRLPPHKKIPPATILVGTISGGKFRLKAGRLNLVKGEW
jgi:hypothetical protein